MKEFYTDSTGAIAFETSPPSPDYSLITGVEKDLLWIAKYEERREDGQNYYTQVQAGLYVSILDGTYTSSEVFDFEEYTSKLADQVFKGDWYTAQDTCSNLATSGIFDTTKKAEIQADLDDYITNNY
jgi:hypothetical protein